MAKAAAVELTLRAEFDAMEAARLWTSVEAMQVYNAVSERGREQAAAGLQWVEDWSDAQAERLLEHDRRLFAEAEDSMSRMAEELEREVCECELCARAG